MKTASARHHHLHLLNDLSAQQQDDEDARLAAAISEAYQLADEIEQLLPPSHRGMAHRLRLTAEAAGGLHIAALARRVVNQMERPPAR